jgi:hypothetical protein
MIKILIGIIGLLIILAIIALIFYAIGRLAVLLFPKLYIQSGFHTHIDYLLCGLVTTSILSLISLLLIVTYVIGNLIIK